MAWRPLTSPDSAGSLPVPARMALRCFLPLDLSCFLPWDLRGVDSEDSGSKSVAGLSVRGFARGLGRAFGSLAADPRTGTLAGDLRCSTPRVAPERRAARPAAAPANLTSRGTVPRKIPCPGGGLIDKLPNWGGAWGVGVGARIREVRASPGEIAPIRGRGCRIGNEGADRGPVDCRPAGLRNPAANSL